MKIRNKHLSVAAVATMLAVAGPGVAIATESGSPGRSAAEINLSDCMLESSKDISYVEYLADGSTVTKDESVDSESLDLSSVEGIEDIDEVTVKAGTTVESFDVSCTGETSDAPEEGDDEADEPEGSESDESESDDGDVEDGEPGDGGETTYPWTGKANYRSTATISLTGCMLESSKDISYVAFLDDGSMVTKDESVDAETFDLGTVEGIEEFDAVQVKAGTTVESFDVSCSQGEVAPVEESEHSDTEDSTSDHESESESEPESEPESAYKSEDKDEDAYEHEDEYAAKAERERGHDEAKHQEKHQARVSENHDEAKHQEKHRGGVTSAEEDSDDKSESNEHESEEKDDHEADDGHQVEAKDEHDD